MPVLFAAFALTPLACGDDDPLKPNSPYLDLSQKWHVLENIERAYNNRNIGAYDQLLDENFTFFLSPGDVGGEVPDQWGRQEELTVNTRIFDPNYAGAHRVKSIDMDVILPEDKSTIQWVEIIPPSAPDEAWYTTTVFYRFRFQTDPDTQYESVAGAKAEFTVRYDNAKKKWQLAEMRDLAAK